MPAILGQVRTMQFVPHRKPKDGSSDPENSLMKSTASTLIAAVLALASASPLADPWKDESGHGRYKGGKYEEKYRDGPCKVKRKWDRGGYKEERKCERPWRPAMIEPPVFRPSVIIDPTGVVILPPPIIIRGY